MKPFEILCAVQEAGGRPRLVDGLVVTDRIENRRLVAVFRDALERITDLLREEERPHEHLAA